MKTLSSTSLALPPKLNSEYNKHYSNSDLTVGKWAKVGAYVVPNRSFSLLCS
jgi:hypothetical protein